MRKGVSRFTVREVARFKVESEVPRAASGKSNAVLLGGLNSIQSETLHSNDTLTLQAEGPSVYLMLIRSVPQQKRPGKEAGPSCRGGG